MKGFFSKKICLSLLNMKARPLIICVRFKIIIIFCKKFGLALLWKIMLPLEKNVIQCEVHASNLDFEFLLSIKSGWLVCVSGAPTFVT